MHELGILRQVVRTVVRIAEERRIRSVAHITLEVGMESGCVPAYLEKLFPLAVDSVPLLKDAQLRIEMVPGRVFLVKEIGY